MLGLLTHELLLNVFRFVSDAGDLQKLRGVSRDLKVLIESYRVRGNITPSYQLTSQKLCRFGMLYTQRG